jgi:hypothetical protein
VGQNGATNYPKACGLNDLSADCQVIAAATGLILNFDQFRAMGSDGHIEFAGKFAEVLLPPKIPSEMFAREFEV